MESNNIPKQLVGAKTDCKSEVQFQTQEQAMKHFELVKNRLLNVSSWDELAGKSLSKFYLINSEGETVHRLATQNDFFKIDIPGPGSKNGEGFDWVRVEEINEHQEGDNEMLSIRVRPALNPHNDEEAPAHFFKDSATSTFLVKRTGKIISAEVHGRNELPNTKGGFLDTIRNATIAISAMLGLSKPQWKGLVDGLVKVP